jgi:hypothetical protein
MEYRVEIMLIYEIIILLRSYIGETINAKFQTSASIA